MTKAPAASPPPPPARKGLDKSEVATLSQLAAEAFDGQSERTASDSLGNAWFFRPEHEEGPGLLLSVTAPAEGEEDAPRTVSRVLPALAFGATDSIADVLADVVAGLAKTVAHGR